MHKQNMGYERFLKLHFEDFPGTVTNPFFRLDPDPYRFCLDPDPYQSSSWIRIRDEFFHILDPDPYQNQSGTDLPHCQPHGSFFIYHLRFFFLFSCLAASWGPEDDGKTVDGPGPLAK